MISFSRSNAFCKKTVAIRSDKRRSLSGMASNHAQTSLLEEKTQHLILKTFFRKTHTHKSQHLPKTCHVTNLALSMCVCVCGWQVPALNSSWAGGGRTSSSAGRSLPARNLRNPLRKHPLREWRFSSPTVGPKMQAFGGKSRGVYGSPCFSGGGGGTTNPGNAWHPIPAH